MKSNVLLLIVALGCLAFLGGVSVFVVGIVRQSRTSSWPAAPAATIIASTVESNGDGLEPRISYRYQVGATWHAGDTIQLGGRHSSSSGDYARRLCARFPSGTPATVYYDPADPSRSVLLPGLDEHQWMMIGFLCPFVTFPSMMLTGIFWSVFLKPKRGYIGTVRVFEPAPGITVARVSTWGPLAAAISVLLPASIVVVFLVLALPEEWARTTVLTCAGATIVAMPVAAYYRCKWIAAGRSDTVINATTGTLLPARGGKAAVDAVPLDRVTGTRLLQERHDTSDSTYPWHVHAVLADGAASIRVAEIHGRDDAATFERWLSNRLAAAKRGGT